MEKNDKCLKNNMYCLEQYQITLINNYNKLKEELKKYKSDDSKLGRTFTLSKEESSQMILISTLPSLINAGIWFTAVVSMAGAASISLTNNFNHYTGEALKICEDLALKTQMYSDKISISADHFIKGLIFPASLIGLSIPKTIKESMKKNKKEEIVDKMCYIDDAITLIEDLKNERNDISINFIREFLSNVDITKNKMIFNSKLLNKFVNYRITFLKLENDEVVSKDKLNCFSDLINFLTYSDKEPGVSETFLQDNPYATNLVINYMDSVARPIR